MVLSKIIGYALPMAALFSGRFVHAMKERHETTTAHANDKSQSPSTAGSDGYGSRASSPAATDQKRMIIKGLEAIMIPPNANQASNVNEEETDRPNGLSETKAAIDQQKDQYGVIKQSHLDYKNGDATPRVGQMLGEASELSDDYKRFLSKSNNIPDGKKSSPTPVPPTRDEHDPTTGRSFCFPKSPEKPNAHDEVATNFTFPSEVTTHSQRMTYVKEDIARAESSISAETKTLRQRKEALKRNREELHQNMAFAREASSIRKREKKLRTAIAKHFAKHFCCEQKEVLEMIVAKNPKVVSQFPNLGLDQKFEDVFTEKVCAEYRIQLENWGSIDR